MHTAAFTWRMNHVSILLDLRLQGRPNQGGSQRHRHVTRPADSALREAQKSNENTQAPGSHLLINGLAAITSAYPPALRVAEDVAKYHFAGFNCLCLRCGALFDEPGEKESSKTTKQPP